MTSWNSIVGLRSHGKLSPKNEVVQTCINVLFSWSRTLQVCFKHATSKYFTTMWIEHCTFWYLGDLKWAIFSRYRRRQKRLSLVHLHCSCRRHCNGDAPKTFMLSEWLAVMFFQTFSKTNILRNISSLAPSVYGSWRSTTSNEDRKISTSPYRIITHFSAIAIWLFLYSNNFDLVIFLWLRKAHKKKSTIRKGDM